MKGGGYGSRLKAGTTGFGAQQGLTALGRRAIEHGPLSTSQKATMPVRLDRSSADFDQRFAAFLGAKREVSADVERATRAIVVNES